MKVANLQKNIDSILARFALKKTAIRRAILEAFFKSKESLTQADLIQYLSKVGNHPDRISIYRNLNQMKTVGIIHEVDTNKYVACTHQCIDHPHILFFCQKCNRYQEVKVHSDVSFMMRTLEKFRFFDVHSPLSMKGTCKKCSRL